MKKLLLGLTLLTSFTAFAGECLISLEAELPWGANVELKEEGLSDVLLSDCVVEAAKIASSRYAIDTLNNGQKAPSNELFLKNYNYDQIEVKYQFDGDEGYYEGKLTLNH